MAGHFRFRLVHILGIDSLFEMILENPQKCTNEIIFLYSLVMLQTVLFTCQIGLLIML